MAHVLSNCWHDRQLSALNTIASCWHLVCNGARSVLSVDVEGGGTDQVNNAGRSLPAPWPFAWVAMA